MRLKNYTISAILLFIAISSFAQMPNWVKRGTPNSTSGKYYYAMGQGKTLEEAVYTTVKSGAKLQGFTAITDQSLERSLKIQNNKRTTKHNSLGTVSFEDKKVNIFIAEQYFDYSNNVYHVLIGFSKNENIQSPLKPLACNTNAIWRSAIVPGWGQFYKKQSLKGGVIIGSFAALAGSSIYFENKRTYNSDRIQETTNITIAKEYKSRADNYATYRNVSIIGALGVYVFNIIDAAASKGNLYADNKSRNWELYADNFNNQTTLGVSIKF
ncbi:MAG: hypothetical protein JEZ09_02280 [Salinivirgaceae bacterium]|nr:hypothetical protein [Salinivirgaceae bacterium]